jgi:hypothetical protein
MAGIDIHVRLVDICGHFVAVCNAKGSTILEHGADEAWVMRQLKRSVFRVYGDRDKCGPDPDSHLDVDGLRFVVRRDKVAT